MIKLIIKQGKNSPSEHHKLNILPHLEKWKHACQQLKFFFNLKEIKLSQFLNIVNNFPTNPLLSEAIHIRKHSVKATKVSLL